MPSVYEVRPVWATLIGATSAMSLASDTHASSQCDSHCHSQCDSDRSVAAHAIPWHHDRPSGRSCRRCHAYDFDDAVSAADAMWDYLQVADENGNPRVIDVHLGDDPDGPSTYLTIDPLSWEASADRDAVSSQSRFGPVSETNAIDTLSPAHADHVAHVQATPTASSHDTPSGDASDESPGSAGDPHATGGTASQAAVVVPEAKRYCWHCRIIHDDVAVKLKVCTRCKTARYCSIDCQRKDWKSHKDPCGVFKKLRAKPTLPLSYSFISRMVCNDCHRTSEPGIPLYVCPYCDGTTRAMPSSAMIETKEDRYQAAIDEYECSMGVPYGSTGLTIDTLKAMKSQRRAMRLAARQDSSDDDQDLP